MKVIDKREEFIEYSKSHSADETAKYFGICKNYAIKLRKKWCGISKPKNPVTGHIKKNDFINYRKKHTAKECAEYFGIKTNTVYSLCAKYGLRHYRNFSDDYIKNGHNVINEFPLYAKEHTATECAKFFGVSKSVIRWWQEKYKVKCKTKAKTIKQVARKLYILDDGKNVYYFVGYDDIAEFCGLTRTRVNVLIKKEHKIHQYTVRTEKITSYRYSSGAIIKR